MAARFAYGSFWQMLLLVSVVVASFVDTGCSSSNEKSTADSFEKITFDMTALDEDGLYGPHDGLRALDYEFCIPANTPCLEEVIAIDTTVVVHRSSPGRIGCSMEEFLCIGNTHQKDFKQILRDLAALEYIERIDMCVYE